MEGDDNDAHSFGKQRTGVDVLLPLLAAACSCWVGTERDIDNTHSLGKWRTGVDVPLLLSETQITMTTQLP